MRRSFFRHKFHSLLSTPAAPAIRTRIFPFIAFVLAFTLIPSFHVFATVDSSLPSSNTDTETAVPSASTTLLNATLDGVPSVDGNAFVLYDPQSKTFITGKEADTPLSPASITKVMTVLLALENLKMDDTITITRDMYESISDDYVRLGLVDGEIITVESAIYACLLNSSNDAAMALAYKMSGSVEGFADLMNKRAVELGCTGTHFTNPYGYADPNHLTTAHDMALILTEALTHPEYQQISTTANYTFPATNKSGIRNLTNGNKFISTSQYAYEYYIGGKTGVTDLSGHTICAGASKNGRELIGVILGASSSNVRYENLISLFDYGFSTYTTCAVDPSEFASIKDSTLNQVTSCITSAGYSLEVKDTKLDVVPFLTTTQTRYAGGYKENIDTSQAVIHSDQALQTLVFPLTRVYGDGAVDPIGTLTITIGSTDPVALAAAEKAAEQTPVDVATLIVKIVIIVILLVILGFALYIYYRMQKRRHHRKSRQYPKVL